MSNNVEHLKIFFSSPGDVFNLSEVVQEVVKSLNVSWSRDKHIHVQVLTSRDVPPAPASGSAQSVVDKFISDQKIDIYVGLLGSRFGTPTRQFGSGTEQEFRGALANYKAGGHVKYVFFGFFGKKVDPYKIDPDQLAKVLKFKDDIKNDVFHQTFSNEKDFRERFSHYIDSYINEFASRPYRGVIGGATVYAPSPKNSSP